MIIAITMTGTYRRDHLYQQFALAWLSHAHVLHLPPAICQSVTANNGPAVARRHLAAWDIWARRDQWNELYRVYGCVSSCYTRQTKSVAMARSVLYKKRPTLRRVRLVQLSLPQLYAGRVAAGTCFEGPICSAKEGSRSASCLLLPSKSTTKPHHRPHNRRRGMPS